MIIFANEKQARRAKRRLNNERKAIHTSINKECIDYDLLSKQNEFEKQARNLYKENTVMNSNHYHICTFSIYSNDKAWQRCQCKKWRMQHPIELPIDFEPECVEDYCDYCPMLNYMTVDEEGKVMYIQRNFPEELIKWENSRRTND